MKFIDEVRKINKKADRDFYERNDAAIRYLKARIISAAEKGQYFAEAHLDLYRNYDLEYIRKYFIKEGFKSFSYSELPYVKKILVTIQWDKG